MTESNLPHDTYDLDHQRDFDAFRDDHDSARTTSADLRHMLQYCIGLMREIDRIREKRNALCSCLNFLVRVLKTWPDPSPNLDRLYNVTALPRNRPATDEEVTERLARLSLVEREQSIENMDIQPLKCLVDLVRWRSRRDGGWFEGPRLLYRVHRPNSHTFYNEDVGFCCARWHRGLGVEEPSK